MCVCACLLVYLYMLVSHWTAQNCERAAHTHTHILWMGRKVDELCCERTNERNERTSRNVSEDVSVSYTMYTFMNAVLFVSYVSPPDTKVCYEVSDFCFIFVLWFALIVCVCVCMTCHLCQIDAHVLISMADMLRWSYFLCCMCHVLKSYSIGDVVAVIANHHHHQSDISISISVSVSVSRWTSFLHSFYPNSPISVWYVIWNFFAVPSIKLCFLHDIIHTCTYTHLNALISIRNDFDMTYWLICRFSGGNSTYKEVIFSFEKWKQFNTLKANNLSIKLIHRFFTYGDNTISGSNYH